MKLVDLTHTLEPGIPDWDGCCGFNMSEAFYTDDAICVQTLQTPAGIGTHMDAPSHFAHYQGDIASLELNNLVAPAAVIDVRNKVQVDYFISKQDIIEHENNHGALGQGMLILGLTGWSQYWIDHNKYRNANASGHRIFPGFSLEAVEYLLQKDIVGLGIDTLSPDGSHQAFPVHRAVLGAGKYIIENLHNLELLPAQGARVIALPLKLGCGAEAPARVIAEL